MVCARGPAPPWAEDGHAPSDTLARRGVSRRRWAVHRGTSRWCPAFAQPRGQALVERLRIRRRHAAIVAGFFDYTRGDARFVGPRFGVFLGATWRHPVERRDKGVLRRHEQSQWRGQGEDAMSEGCEIGEMIHSRRIRAFIDVIGREIGRVPPRCSFGSFLQGRWYESGTLASAVCVVRGCEVERLNPMRSERSPRSYRLT